MTVSERRRRGLVNIDVMHQLLWLRAGKISFTSRNLDQRVLGVPKEGVPKEKRPPPLKGSVALRPVSECACRSAAVGSSQAR